MRGYGQVAVLGVDLGTSAVRALVTDLGLPPGIPVAVGAADTAATLDGAAVLLRQRPDDLGNAGHAPRRVIPRTAWLAAAGAARLAAAAGEYTTLAHPQS